MRVNFLVIDDIITLDPLCPTYPTALIMRLGYVIVKNEDTFRYYKNRDTGDVTTKYPIIDLPKHIYSIVHKGVYGG